MGHAGTIALPVPLRERGSAQPPVRFPQVSLERRTTRGKEESLTIDRRKVLAIGAMGAAALAPVLVAARGWLARGGRPRGGLPRVGGAGGRGGSGALDWGIPPGPRVPLDFPGGLGRVGGTGWAVRRAIVGGSPEREQGMTTWN